MLILAVEMIILTYMIALGLSVAGFVYWLVK